MEHGLKDIKFYVQEFITPQAICYNPCGSWQATSNTHMCDMVYFK